MMEINIVRFEDLPDIEKADQPNNGVGKECANYMKITHGGNVEAVYSDAMEPEDCTFNQDLKWVAVAIEMAYERGKRDA